jgi:hypothetical protein
MARDPYCGKCGYSLVGLTESSKCPECGKPLVEVLTRDPAPVVRGRRYKSDLRIFGLPFIHVALGPHENQRIGVARGIIAVGDVAFGLLSLGGAASFGVIALGGGFGCGVVALGGCAFGLLAFAGLALGGIAFGGAAIGGIALGGGAIGYIAEGGGAVGVYGRGGGVFATHVIDFARRDPEAVRLFSDLSWLLGSAWPPAGWNWTLSGWLLAATLLMFLLLGAIVGIGYLLRPKSAS